MKKNFLEPKAQRIELNLRENIATSSDPGADAYIKVVQANYLSCRVHQTGKLIFECTEADLLTCTVYGTSSTTWSFGKNFPIEELLPYIRH